MTEANSQESSGLDVLLNQLHQLHQFHQLHQSGSYGEAIVKILDNEKEGLLAIGRTEQAIKSRQLFENAVTIGDLNNRLVGLVDSSLWSGKNTDGDPKTRAMLFDALHRATNDDGNSLHGYASALGVQYRIMTKTPENELRKYIPDFDNVKN